MSTPASFGQEKINSFFARALNGGRIPHALIICGEKDSGKLLLAKQFAFECLKTDKDEHPDVRIIDLDEEGIRYIETIRKQVLDNIYLSPYQGEHKFFIIKSAQKMPREAQNAILKSLEEPPEYASIIMLTDNPGKLLPTIKSRSVILHIQPAEKKVIEEFLRKNCEDSDFRIKMAANLSLGIPMKALSILKDETYIDMAVSVAAVAADLTENRNYLDHREEINLFKDEFHKFLELMEIYIRDVLVYKSGGQAADLMIPGWEHDVIRAAGRLTYKRIADILCRIKEAIINLSANVGKDVLMELILLEIGGDS